VSTGWLLCCEPWLKFEVKDFRCSKRLKLKKMFGLWVTPLVGRHVVNEPKVGSHVVNDSKIAYNVGRYSVSELEIF